VLDADKAKQIAVLLNGQNNGAMPAWKQLSDTEIAAVITYTKNNWSQQDRPGRAARRRQDGTQVSPSRIRKRIEKETDMSAVLDHHGHGDTPTTTTTTPHGWRRWVFATNHKDIGTLYLLFSVHHADDRRRAGAGIRAELFQPGLQFVNPELFNQLTTMHGLIMVFGAIMPAFVGFANWMIPLQIGAATWRSRA
jgi:hypothetical protein